MPTSSSWGSGSTHSLLSADSSDYDLLIEQTLRSLRLSDSPSVSYDPSDALSDAGNSLCTIRSNASSTVSNPLFSISSPSSYSGSLSVSRTQAVHRPLKNQRGHARRTDEKENDDDDDDPLETQSVASFESEAVSIATITSGSLSGSQASQVRRDFLADAGLFSVSGSDTSGLSSTERKLLVWQAILVGLEICASEPSSPPSGSVRLSAHRPAHFPLRPLALPTSLNACRKLIKRYAYVNIRDYIEHETGHIDDEEFQIFSSATQLARYTRRTHRYVRLSRAKEDFLNPLLRKIKVPTRLATVSEESDDEE